MSVWRHLVTAVMFVLSSLVLAADPSGKLDINTASAEALAEAIHGVGIKRAQAIVLYREQHGAFSSVDQLAQVRGIGAKTVERNRERLTTGASESDASGSGASESGASE